MKIQFYHRRAEQFNSAADPMQCLDPTNAIDAWIIPTYSAMRESAFQVQLTSSLTKSSAISVISSYDMRIANPSSNQYVICLLADGYPSKRSDFTVVQNWEQAPFCGPSVMMPHWPQRDIKPRDPKRGSSIETVAYFGNKKNLDQSIADPTFEKKLYNDFGITFQQPDSTCWNDYSAVDIAIAIRPAKDSCWEGAKPPSKLINAWLATTAAVVSPESSFLATGIAGRDFLVARDAASTLRAIGRLKDDAELYRQLLSASRLRSRQFHPDRLASQWLHLFKEVLAPAAGGKLGFRRHSEIRGVANRLLYRFKRRQSI